MPFGPALPNGVRTPSTKTTFRTARGVDAANAPAEPPDAATAFLLQAW